ncbi:MAG TPA: hypothetical protein GXX34_03630 [Clostridia bacterium]|nr:hypothetical protein [Clostridia bacterium]
MGFKPRYMATGIGSVPYTEPDEALAMIFQHLPHLPHWPQMPQRTRREHFVYQSLTPLVELGLLVIREDGTCFVRGQDIEQPLTEFYERYLKVMDTGEGLDFFAIPPESGIGLYRFVDYLKTFKRPAIVAVKGQMAGPLSIGLNLHDEERRPVFYHPQLKDVLIKNLALNARWQANFLGQIAPPIIFIDDPAIAAWGTATFVALEREDMVLALKEIIKEIKQAGGMAGLHACAGIDWGVAIEAGVDVISFDAYYYFGSLIGFSHQLQQFLAGGGILAWGIVPTSHAIWEENTNSLLAKFYRQQERLIANGVSRRLLETNVLLTPSCGTGLMELNEAEKVYEMTAALSAQLYRKG